MPDRTQTLKDVISALNTLDKEYFKKQQSLATAKDWKKAERLQQIREGIKHSVVVIQRMLDHKIEVVGI